MIEISGVAMEQKFRGKRVLVTGAGRGIGRAVAIELAKQGAHVIALSRTVEHLNSLKREFPIIEIISVDISEWEETKKIVENLEPVDLLVNNAGLSGLQEFGSVTENEIDRIFAVNLKAVFNISQAIAKGMKARGKGGSIVNVSSVASLVVLPLHATYCASKAALDQLTKVMALELAPHKIRVNSVNPTVVMTDMTEQFWTGKRRDDMKALIPLGRFCEIEDVVKPIMFLLSEDSRMITGVHLPIDGGLIVH